MLNNETGKILLFSMPVPAEIDPQSPYVPGICTVCGVLLPDWHVSILHEDGTISPADLHNDYHRKRGELE